MGRITSENARLMAARSAEARKQRREAAAFAPLAGATSEATSGEYVVNRLARVRVQLDRLDKLMMTESDPQKLDRLASAQARLSEQERILDGCALPGSFRPKQSRVQKTPDLEPL